MVRREDLTLRLKAKGRKGGGERESMEVGLSRNGTQWYTLVHIGTQWYTLVHNGTHCQS